MKCKRGFGILRGAGGKVVVELKREARGRWAVEQLERVAPGGAPSGGLARALGRDTAPVAWLLDESEAACSVVNLPPLKARALERTARGLVARSEGGAADDWAVSCQAATQAAGARDQRQLPVFVLRASRGVVDAQLAEAAQWGAKPRLMLPPYLALDLLYRRHGPERDQHDAWNLVFIGRETSFLFISTRDHVLVTRRLPQDLSLGADLDEYLGRLATEIERSIFFARQTEHSPQVGRIVVCGDHEVAPRVVERLQHLGQVSALYWEIESLFTWGSVAPLPDDLPAVAAALLACEGSPLNLCPDRRRRLLSTAVRRRGLVAVGTAAVAAVPILLIGGLVTSRVQGEYLRRAQGRLHEAEARAERAETVYREQRLLLAREDRIAAFSAARPDLESVLRRLAALTPSTVVYKSLRLEEGGTNAFVLHLEGESIADDSEPAQAAFVSFLAALHECGFAQVVGEPRRMQIRPGEGTVVGERTQFSLDLKLAAPAATPGV